MKGITMVGVGCALFLATISSADAAQETLQNIESCSTSTGIGCIFGNPNDLVECFNNATLTLPYQLTEASYSIESVSLNADPLNLTVYEWSGAGQPGALVNTIPLSATESTPGQHTIILDPAVSLTTSAFCVGVNGTNPSDWFRLFASLPNVSPTSWLKASACGLSTFGNMANYGFGNWCITATIADEETDTDIQVDIDIKFCSDPNAFNCKKKGVLPVTIFGTDSFAVADVDVSSLRLCLADLTTCTGAPRDWSVSDRGDPLQDLGANMCAINQETGLEEDFLSQDGFLDLDVAFEASEVKATLLVDFCNQPKGTISPALFIVGTTFDGAFIYSLQLDDVAVDQLMKKNR